jgi:hypothetical protein
MIYKIKRDAERRDISFDVEAKYLYELFEFQQGLCALTGTPITLPKCNDDDRHYNYTASLDRIDSKKPYVAGNVQWIHKTLQWMKWDKPESEFVEWCRKVAVYHEQQSTPS